METGLCVEVQKWAAEFKESDEALSKAIETQTTYVNRVFNQVRLIEYVTLTLTVLGMAGLVALVWWNF
jgi:hypothetical protein